MLMFFPDLELSAVKMSKKDGLWKYIQTAQQKKPQNFKKKIDMGATPYLQSVVEEVPTGTRFEDLKDLKNGQ